MPESAPLLLFAETSTRSRALPIIGEQKDITYLGSRAKAVLNGPETTGMGFWSINPYVGCAFGCAYCYARYAHRYTVERSASAHPEHEQLRAARDEMPAWLAFERRIFVKENAAEVLRQTLRNGSSKHLALLRDEGIVIGTATDPYQPAERRFRITRAVLEVLAEHPGLAITIITKSPLVTRDVDVLRRIVRHSVLRVHVSLITLDRELARRLEPRAPTPDARLRAVSRLAAAGVRVSVNVMPVLPGITDGPKQLDALVGAIARAGAASLGACALRLQSAARQRYLPFIEQEFPALAARYRRTYAHGHQAGERYRTGLRTFMQALCDRHGIEYGYDASRPDAARHRLPDDGTVEQLVLELADSGTTPIAASGR